MCCLPAAANYKQCMKLRKPARRIKWNLNIGIAKIVVEVLESRGLAAALRGGVACNVAPYSAIPAPRALLI